MEMHLSDCEQINSSHILWFDNHHLNPALWKLMQEDHKCEPSLGPEWLNKILSNQTSNQKLASQNLVV